MKFLQAVLYIHPLTGDKEVYTPDIFLLWYNQYNNFTGFKVAFDEESPA